MVDLSDFSGEERTLIISVPYRVGIWISTADDNTKTKFDDKLERQALSAVISKLATRSQKMPFAAAVMSGVDSSKSLWPGWESDAVEKNVLEDVENAIGLCRRRLSKGELNQYRQTIWQIGLIVAQAFGEQIDPDNEMHVNRFFAWMGSFTGVPSLSKAPENMSKTEKTALKKLSAVLKG